MNAKKVTILLVFTVLLIFSVVSRIFFNDFQDGWIAYENKDYETARKLWTPLAEQGEPRAQFFMGFMHDMGFGVPEDDKQAVKWYQLAVEQGDSRAQLFMGYMHDFGQGVQEDNQEAFKYYLLALEQGYKHVKINIYNLAMENIAGALKVLTTDAENGVVQAQYALGVMYANGQGVLRDVEEAIKWYQLAAEQGYKPAKVNIYGLAKKNSPEALKILMTDAENGVVQAQYELGVMYANGQGVLRDVEEAVKWYQFAAEQENKQAKENIYNLAKKNSPEALKILVNDAENGSTNAQSTLSIMYLLGLGVPQDNHESVKWYQFAAERKFAAAKKEMISFRKQNIPQALKFLSNDAENGTTKAQLDLGLMMQLGLMVPKDGIVAAKWFRLAAEQGSIEARSILGLMYAKGQGVPQDDREALKWFRLLAKQSIVSEKRGIYKLAKQNVPHALKILTDDAEKGNTNAQLNLGLMLRFGLGVQKDEKKAAEWYRIAADQGNSSAQSILGLMYANGQGVSQDDQEALKWFQLAGERRVASEKNAIYQLAKNNISSALKILKADAENGIAEAQYYLGTMHANESGVQYDPVLAHMWYNLSDLQGHKDVENQIEIIEKRMSPQQIAQAQEMVRDWKPRK